MKYGRVINEEEYEKVCTAIYQVKKDLNDILKFDIMAGTYSDKVCMRVEKMQKEIWSIQDILGDYRG